ncbi:uroporphyrinogen-III synthase [Tsukamurella asaccharolytica]|uniref:Uroporphyrinogen-III synthase n=1 Tax=Tsukamurella asaccharolytica TaxID=2592067 RepID=A0A5C5R7M6_9ACTN|nr:uroporphyrinogen-III synthase [Tsukamurella asaccharolytica]TWS18622.1 uroporphyrinogen-III synthase [Tsukamurella asaccharolytica]
MTAAAKEHDPMTEAPVRPLLGFTVAITAARRADELATLLERRGATVLAAPAIAIVPLSDDERLRAATEALLAAPPDLLVATTGIGFRGWLEAAEGWGVAESLLAALGAGRVISRGPKATGALRAAGLREEWSPESESSAEVLSHLARTGLSGLRVAVQLHGAPDKWDPNPGLLDGLRALGATIVEVPVYRWERPADVSGLDRIIETLATSAVDAITFTSAPAAASVLERAAELGLDGAVRGALSGPVVPYCVGPVTATPLDQAGITSVTPERMRLGALARLVEQDLPDRRPDLPVAGHRLGLRARGAVVDGEERELTPTSIVLLRLLSREPGAVVSRDDLLAALGGDDPHAVEAAVARLRAGLGHKEIVATVVKRGYRLATDEEH